MSDLIDRQAAIDALDKLHYNDREDWCFVLDTIEYLPSAEPEQKKGKWVEREGIYGAAYCSKCGYELRMNNTNYCPNCGAEMRGEE